MSRDRHQRLVELFSATYEAPPEERRDVLDRACEGDPELRREVERMLARHDEGESFLEHPALGGMLRAPPVTAHVERSGEVIDRYKLLEEIGSGGFGTVWMAEQTEPVRRRVALKVIKLGMDTRQVLARFEAERQALALMDHPGIARVFDGGATEGGRPYFVMELVRGAPITKYCDETNLSFRDRLELFREVCHAVQHAHQKGVIHRDLKPSNVLVAEVDGRAVPKVIDFGIAKATSTPLTEKTLFTGFRQMIGTPEYMSPEQAARQDVDTRADVYSLGVLLYELLTGTKPFERETFLEAGYEAMLRVLREVDPPRPSTRATSLGERAVEIARHRHTSPRLMGRYFRGDLDWIVMKALEKDRQRRYATASSLADDIGRHLTDQPVEAGPPSPLYRLRKYYRRHELGVTAGAAIMVSLVAGLVTSVSGYSEAREQAELARTEAGKAKTVLSLVQDMLGSADPHEFKGPNYTVGQLLDDFDRRLGDALDDQPEVEAAINQTMGSAYNGLGLSAKARPYIEAALATWRQQLGDDDPTTHAALVDLAVSYHNTGDYLEAKRLMREALDRARRIFGERSQEAADALQHLADFDRHLDSYDDAKASAREALAIVRELHPSDSVEVRDVLSRLASIHAANEEYEEAERLHLQIIEQGDDWSGMDAGSAVVAERVYIRCLIDLGIVRLKTGDLDGGEPLLQEALRRKREQVGDEHPQIANVLDWLGDYRRARRDYEGAARLYRQSLAIYRPVLGDDHPDVAMTLELLGQALHMQGDYEAAEGPVLEALEIRRGRPGEEAHVASLLARLVRLHINQEDYDAAKPLLREALALNRELHGNCHPDVTWVLRHLVGVERLSRERDERRLATWAVELGRCLFAEHRNAEAENAFREALELERGFLSEGDPALSERLGQIGLCLIRQAKYVEAETVLEECVILREEHEPDTWHYYEALSRLGVSLLGQERFGEAEPLLLEGYERMDPPDDRSVRRTHVLKHIVELYETWGRPQEAALWRAELEARTAE